MALAAGGAFSGILFLPLAVSQFASLDFVGLGRAGLVSSVQLAALAAASLASAGLFRNGIPRLLVIVAILCIVAGNLLSGHVRTLAELLVVRGLSGIGEGMLLGLLHLLVARARDPEKVYSIANFTVILWGILLYAVLPGRSMIGLPAVYPAAALLALLALAVMPLLDRVPAGVSSRQQQASAQGAIRLRARAAVIAGLVLFYVGEGGLWAYVGELGGAIGVSAEAIGKVLSGAFFLSLAGPLVVHQIGGRFGRFLPLALSLCGLVAVALVLGFADSHLAYYLGVCAFYFFFIFTVIYSATLAAVLDPTGRTSALVPACRSIGMAIGPALAGLLLTSAGGFEAMSVVVCLAYVLAIAAFSVAVRPDSLGDRMHLR